MATRIQFRRDSAANWTSTNPVLASGEFGVELEAPRKFKIGDGVTAWASLPYALSDQDLSGYVPTTRTVNGHALSANVTVTAADLALGSVDNTADTAKPVSTAQQTALDLKAPLASPTFTGVPAAPTAAAATNTTQLATTAFVRAELTALIASSPAALDTLNELAAALGNDAAFATTVTNALAGKINTSAATTAGLALLGLANPGAVTFLRINADNTVSALAGADFRAAIGAGTGSGSGDALVANPITQFFGVTTIGAAVANSANPGAVAFLRANADNTVTWLNQADQRTALGVGTGDSPVFTAVGIGTGVSALATAFHVASALTTSPRGIMSSQHNDGTDGARLHMRKSRGTLAAPTVIVSGDNLGRLVASGYDGSNYLEMAGIIFGTEGTIAATRVPTNILFQTATDAAPSVLMTRLTISSTGRCTIASTEGSSSTTTGALVVAGGVGASGSIYSGGLVWALALNGNQYITGATSTRSLAAWGVSGAKFGLGGTAITDSSTATSGTAASAVFSSFAAPTLAATNASVTTTDAANVYIAGAPIAGTNQTLTRSHALWVVGAMRWDQTVTTETVVSDRTIPININGTAYKVCIKS
jgi:hypothetical protein